MIVQEKEIVKPLIKQLPKTGLHNKFGICWDKKDTYTVTEVAKEDIKGTVTPTSVLKAANITNFEKENKDKLTIIVYSYIEWERRHREAFNLTLAKKVDNYIGHYRKSDILSDLKNAEQIVVIQVNRNSLKLPKHKNERDIDFYSSQEFNNDSSLYNRVKFLKRNREQWNNETKNWEKVPVTLEEMMNYDTSANLDIQIISTNKKFSLRKTAGSLQEQKWSEMIDKSGYNRNAQLVRLHFALEKFKADKVRDKVKNGDLLSIRANISMLLSNLKFELSMLLNRIGIDDLDIAECYLDTLLTLKRKQKRLENHIAQIGTENEYTPYTMTISDDLKELQQTLIKVIKDVRSEGQV